MNEESLFHEALARSTPEERAAFLDAACAGQPELRAAVESLLAAHEQSGAFLTPPAVTADTTPADASSHPAPAHETENLAGSTGADGGPAPPVLSDGGLPRTSLDSAAAAAAAPDLPDRIGRYEIRRLLGHGGMGAVYLAHDPGLDRPVALKVPKLSGPDAEERFLREARAAAALSHPNLCPVYDVGRADGVPYLAMAYVAGPNLTEMLREDGPPPIARCAAIAAAVAHGMAEAHRHGIVHRDLKPGNILLNRRGEPVVTDFGLALRATPPQPPADPAATVDHQPRLTQVGILMGTPAYMPPEQARGDLGRIGPASDVYALGAILYELLTGRPPFPATPLRDMVRLIETEPAPVPSKVRGKVPPGLDAVCRRAMAKDPAKRFPSMEAFAEALAPFAAQRKRRRWGRVAVAAAAIALLVAVAGAVFYVKTNYGTVEIQLSDPKADVQISVDGNEISLTEGGRVTKLRAGEHGLLVKGEGFQTETKDFKITRGETTIVRVELTKVAGAKAGKPLADPDRVRLAELLARGRQSFSQGRYSDLGLIAEDALKIDPESPGALALRATFRAARNDLAGARADAEAALKLNPETYRALMVRGHLSAEDGKPDEAIADFTAAARLDATDPVVWTNRASCYFKKGEYRQTITDATRAIELKLPRPNAYLNRAAAHACLGQYDKALADYDAAEKIDPRDPATFAQRSALHIKMGNPEKAAVDWDKARALDPSLRLESRSAIPDPPKPPERKKLTAEEAGAFAAALKLAEDAWDAGRLDDCARAAEQAVRIDPTSAPAREMRARVRIEQGHPLEARQDAEEAVRLDPTLASGYLRRGTARAALNDPAGAIADLTIAPRLEPGLPYAWNNRGWAYQMRGQYRQALADLNEAIRLKPNVAALSNRGDCHLHLGDYEKALEDFARAAELQPTNARWRMACAAVRAKLGDAAGAAKDRERALKIDPQQQDVVLPVPLPPAKKDPELPAGPEPGAAQAPADRARLARLLARGGNLIQQGQLDGLEAIAADALKIDPESPGALALRATSRGARGDLEGARRDVDAALKLNPGTLQALRVSSYLYDLHGKHDDSIADATVAVRIDPTYAPEWSNRANAYLARGDYGQAIADAGRTIELRFRQPDGYVIRGAAYACLGEYEKALADYDIAAKMAPDTPRVFAQRSAVHAIAGHEEAAGADWAKAKQLDPTLKPESRPAIPPPPKPPQRKKLTPEEAKELDRALAAFRRAWGTGNEEGCRKAAEEACRIDPTSAAARSAKARFLAQTGQFTEALAEANEALRLDPNDASAYSVRATARTDANDAAGGVADATISLRLDPQLAATWNTRGWAYWRRGQYHQAIADLSEAIQLRPNYELPYATRGNCWLRLGDYEKALADYTKVSELQPTAAMWRMMCAAIRARTGDADGARRDREVALKLDPKQGEVILPAPLPPVKTDPEPAGER